MATYQILYWRDIPAQIKVYKGKRKRPVSRQMPERFQVEIDRIAMKEGLDDSDDYLELWQWTEKRERAGDVEEVASALLRELEAEYEQKTDRAEGK